MEIETPSVWGASLAILLLIAVSGFLSGAETALTAASRSKMHQLEKEGSRRARLINKLRRNSDRLIGAMLIGSNMFNIIASALATSVLIVLFGESGVAIASIGMTAIVIVFSEIIPKTYAINNSERMSLACAPVISFFVYLFYPISISAQYISRGFLRLVGIEIPNDIGQWISDEELRGAIELHARHPESEEEERAMLRSILDLDEVTVGEILTHRRHLIMIDVNQPNEKIIEIVVNSPYSRLPVYAGDMNNIIGVLHTRTLFAELEKNAVRKDQIDIRKLCSDPWFVPESTTLLEQLRQFRLRKEHVAIVIDEYGDLQGIVTLEDVLEEIVGDIFDEFDISMPGVKVRAGGEIIVNGAVTIRDLNRQFHWNLPDDNATTVAGLVLHEARTIPRAGQAFKLHGIRFEVLAQQNNRILTLKITPPKRRKAAE